MTKAATVIHSEVFLSLGVYILSMLLLPPVTDDYAYFMHSMAAGQFSDFGLHDVHYQGYIGYRELYDIFYRVFADINWHYCFHQFLSFFSLYLLLRCLRLVVFRAHGNEVITVLIQLLFAIFFVENIALVSHTRVSMLYCGVGLFHLAFQSRLTLKSIGSYAALFIAGMLLRPESAMGMLLLVGVGALIYHLHLVTLIKRLWIPAALVCIFLVIFAIDVAHTNIYTLQIEPEIEYQMMANRMITLSQMKTTADSAKYEAAKLGMWFDTSVMTPSYLRSLLLSGPDLSAAHALEVLAHVAGFYIYYIFIPVAILVLLLVSYFFKKQWQWSNIKILSFAFATFAICYCLDYTGLLICGRHFISIQIISLLILCYYLFEALPLYLLSKQLALCYASLLVLLLSLVITLSHYAGTHRNIAQQTASMERMMKQLDRQYNHTILASTIDGRFLFDRRFASVNELYHGNTYLMHDWFTFDLSPRYVAYTSRSCHCDGGDPVSVFRWLAAHHAIYIASARRFELTERYMRAVHHLSLHFSEPIEIVGMVSPEMQLRIVQVE